MSEKPKGSFNVGVDLGTSNLLIYVEGRGTIFNEPSYIAVDKATKQVVSVGFDAAELVGKVHDKVEVVKPLQGGVISDVSMIREILNFTFDQLFVNSSQQINKLLICIPSEITETEKAAILQLGEELGIDDTKIDEEIKAAAIGSGVDIYTPSGHLVVDLGGGTTDFGVLSLGDVVLSKSIKVAGDYFDKQISDYVKEKHKLEIGPQTAEKAKIALASLTGDMPKDESGKPLTFDVMGRDLVSGLPKKVTLEASEIRTILLDAFEAVKATLIATLETTPPELAGDLVDNGIIVTGGGAKIKGIKDYIEQATNVEVHISPTPLTDVVDGTKKLLKINKNHYFGEF
ncbi:rod shape-determining protein [Candidatus Xianfuyuplasma coldseepsis]|uniref:Cell shape-determining protein MreB n=1 Tax=Candidatus Xianfuyuplasma coldseepsis TaxID=2782163 RepID=A0A7L7KQS2_9MOLU|nr:rod shape-determining protein [Xianfuyuplasma coldseepsis]QMS84566.1 rod shape-determining protein [Xianfuyuplasma coldseepsis]